MNSDWAPSNQSTTTEDVANWMFEVFERDEILVQQYAAFYIGEKFGKNFVSTDNRIDKQVLSAFRKLHGGKAKWDTKQKLWVLKDDDSC